MKSIVTSIAASSLLAALAMAQAPQYNVTDLGAVGPNGQPFMITNNGLVAGGVQPTAANPLHAVLWYQGIEKDFSAALAPAGFTGPNSQALWVNDRFQLAGYAETSKADPNGEDFCGFGDHMVCLPFLSQFGFFTTTSLLPTLGGSNGVAMTINNRGQVAGFAENASLDPACPPPQKYQFEAVLWTNGKPQELATVHGDLEGLAWAVNDTGQVAGASGVCAPFNPIFGNSLQSLHAILWSPDGTPNDLGNLGGTGNGIGIFAKNLNNQGQVVGFSDLKGDQTFGAFIWSKATGIQPLPGLLLPGGVSSGALAINDAGVVTGFSVDAMSVPTAVIWQSGVNGALTDLNTLIPAGSNLQLWTACSITSRGEIVGIALSTSDGNFHGYKLTPR